MAGVGVNGGYAPWLDGAPYPPGPVSWPSAQQWPIIGATQVNGQDLNQQLSLPMSFLAAKPFVQVAQQVSGGQAIPTGNVTTPITFDTEIADPWNMHGNVSDTSKIIIPAECDGIWLLQGSIPYTISTNHNYTVGIMYDGTPQPSTGEQYGLPTGAALTLVTPSYIDLVSANAGDSFQLYAQQNSGASLNTGVFTTGTAMAGAYYPYLTARWVAALTGTSGLTPPNITNMFANPVVSADFNNYITNPVNFLSYAPYSRVVMQSGSSIPSGANTAVTGLVATLDNYSAWNFSTQSWVCQVPGVYLVAGQVQLASQATNYTMYPLLGVTPSGGTLAWYVGAKQSGLQPIVSITRRLRFNTGDTLQLGVFQSSGSSMSLGGGVASGTVRLITLWQSR